VGSGVFGSLRGDQADVCWSVNRSAVFSLFCSRMNQGDEDLEARVAQLASLVECDLDICRSALRRAHGNLDLAVRFVFDNPTGSDSGQDPPAPDRSSDRTATIAVDDDLDMPQARHDAGALAIGRVGRARSRLSLRMELSAQPHQGESPAKRPRMRYSVPPQQAMEMLQTSSEPSSSSRSPVMMDDPPLVPRLRPPVDTSDSSRSYGCASMSTMSRPKAAQAGSRGSLFVETSPSAESWTPIPGECLLGARREAPGSQAWMRQILLREPPCLTLKGQLDGVGLPSYSSGNMRQAISRVMNASRCGDHVQLPSSVLADGVSDLVAGVRYPPASVEFAWRVRDLQGRSYVNAAPADLRGKLPERPFRLLNNRDDPLAEQPRLFKGPQLRPDQLRSLSWMLAQEGHTRLSRSHTAASHRPNEGDDEAESATKAGDDELDVNDHQQAEPDLFHVDWRRFWTQDGDGGDPLLQFLPGVKVRFAHTVCCGARNVDTGQRAETAADLPTCTGSVVRTEGENLLLVDFFDFGVWECHMDDLQFDGGSEIAVGARVCVKPSVAKPKYGWGRGIDHNSVGTVVSIGPKPSSLRVNFPNLDGWQGEVNEMQVVASTPGQAYMVEARARAYYKVRGGLLCDSIGYGKTATTIGLISSTYDAELPPIPEIDKGSFIPAKGTLIIVPSNLFDQWLSELAKFAWHGHALRGKMNGGWSPKSCPLKIFAMSTVRPLSSAVADAVASADVVLCSYRLLYSQVYCKRRAELAKVLKGGEGHRDDLSRSDLMAISTILRKLGGYEPNGGVSSHAAVNAESPLELKFPLLEMFYWRRIVFDEFHELESIESTQQHSLQHMRSHYRWGLTGTPPIASNAGVIFMSSLFRVDLPGYLTDGTKRLKDYPDLSKWEADRLLTETATRFLDRFARQNTAELPHVRLQNHVIYVRHTPAERALYLGQAHDAPDFAALGAEAFASEEGAKAVERLLKLCSHFQAVGDHVTTAKEECQRIGEWKEKQVTRARNQVERLCRVLHIMEYKVKSTKGAKAAAWRQKVASQLDTFKAEGSDKAIGGRVAADVEEAMAHVAKETPEHRIAGLDGHRAHHPKLLEYLGQAGPRGHTREQWERFSGTSIAPATLTELFEALTQQQVQNLVALRDSVASLEFFQQTLRAVHDDATPESRSCSVCLEDGLPLSRLAITPCAHTFCIDCLKQTVQKYAACSMCRKALDTKDIRPIEVELTTSSDSASSSSAGGSEASADAQNSHTAASSSSSTTLKVDARYDRYGTKLAVLMSKLEQIRSDDPRAKVILFVQFDDLKRKVASALTDFSIPVVLLHGSVAQRANTIYDWQNNATSSSFVLLLSLAQSASGTNLTAANHVVFLHPMLATTREQAISFEMQAIGRARRHGQLRDTVHTWRLVTVDTVEQHMSQQHQASSDGEEVMIEHAAPAVSAPATGT